MGKAKSRKKRHRQLRRLPLPKLLKRPLQRSPPTRKLQRNQTRMTKRKKRKRRKKLRNLKRKLLLPRAKRLPNQRLKLLSRMKTTRRKKKRKRKLVVTTTRNRMSRLLKNKSSAKEEAKT